MSWLKIALTALCLCPALVQAAISLSGTRLIFDGNYPEASIQASNVGEQAVLLQAWLSEEGGDGVHAPTLPFLVTPHLVQMQPAGKQTLRVLYQGVGMPADRETLFYLYVTGIPRRSEAAQQLSIAVRQRINVFYRPKGLSGDPAQAAQRLSWQWLGQSLQVNNPTPFHVVLMHVILDGVELTDHLLIKPQSTVSLSSATPVARGANDQRLSFAALTDYGGQRDYCARVQDMQATNARLMQPADDSLIRKC